MLPQPVQNITPSWWLYKSAPHREPCRKGAAPRRGSASLRTPTTTQLSSVEPMTSLWQRTTRVTKEQRRRKRREMGEVRGLVFSVSMRSGGWGASVTNHAQADGKEETAKRHGGRVKGRSRSASRPPMRPHASHASARMAVGGIPAAASTAALVAVPYGLDGSDSNREAAEADTGDKRERHPSRLPCQILLAATWQGEGLWGGAVRQPWGGQGCRGGGGEGGCAHRLAEVAESRVEQVAVLVERFLERAHDAGAVRGHLPAEGNAVRERTPIIVGSLCGVLQQYGG